MKRLYIRLATILLPLIVILVLLLLFVKVKTVTHFNMASTLLPGDRIWVMKSKHLERNQVILYRNPGYYDRSLNDREMRTSRLVALPGDTVILRDKNLFINRDTTDAPVDVRFNFRVVTDGNPIDPDFLKEHDIQEPEMVAGIGIFDIHIPPALADSIQNLHMVKTIRSTKQFAGDSSRDYYPLSYYFVWNRDQFGPLIVPKKGDKVAINVKTVDLYRDIIERHEGNEIMIDYRGVFINGEKTISYVFQKDYYFILDDNRDSPLDSRIIGFVPFDHLVGQVKRILISKQKSFENIRQKRPDRFMKKVN